MLVKESASHFRKIGFGFHCFLDELPVLVDDRSKFTEHTAELLAKSDFPGFVPNAESAVSFQVSS